MTYDELIQEMEGLGKGLGSIGAKISKAAGAPGMNVAANAKPIAPGAEGAPKLSGGSGNAGMPPEGQEPIDTTPETVEALPEAEPLEFDRLGSPDKQKLRGHVVKWGGKDHILDWDEDYEVYKIVNPVTLRVKTRIKPESISTVDYKPESLEDRIYLAVDEHINGVPVDQLIDMLLDG